MTYYDKIGEEFIAKAVREFYSRAVLDPIIGHFFFNLDVEPLIAKQIIFACKLLGKKDSEPSPSRSLKSVHHPLGIRSPHFARRQILMEEVLNDLGFDPELKKAWLSLEAQLKALIVKPKERFPDV